VAQAGGGTLPTACLPDTDGKKYCLVPCDDVTKDKCGPDFECAVSAFGDKRCLRAPIGDPSFWQTCMPEAQEYEIHAGDAFTVSGTQSGFLTSEVADPKTGECGLPPQTLASTRLIQWRVPLSPTVACPANVQAQPLAESIDPSLQTNVCLVSKSNGVERIHFENPIFNIVVQVPTTTASMPAPPDMMGGPPDMTPPPTVPLVPPDGTSVSFVITGGGTNLISQLGVDVQAQQPKSVAVAPDGQTLYIVDEGKSPSGAGLRGQILRLFTPSQSIDTTFVVR
jgi:hypothetical protein